MTRRADQAPPVREPVIEIDEPALDGLAPFYLRLDASGRIVGAGRTLRKLIGDAALLGADFFERFLVRKPRGVATLDDLLGATGKQIHARTLGDGALDLRGAAQPLADGGVLMIISLGPQVVDTVTAHGLRSADFSPADSTIDLLFMLSTQKQMLADATELMARLRASQAEAERQAVTDALTGLPNRRGVSERLSQLPSHGAVLVIDLDHFKEINDALGHDAGDAALKFAAEVLRQSIRGEDMIARTGGDEFVGVFVGEQTPADIETFSERLAERLCQPLPFAQNRRLGVSIGVRMIDPAEALDHERLLSDADLALYAAKRSGRGRMAVFDPSMRARFELEAQQQRQVRDALAADAFIPYFQPQISLATGAIVGFEVLARMQNAQGAALSPGVFLDIGQRIGVLAEIDDQVRKKAIAAFGAWRRAGLGPPALSINVPPQRLSDPAFADTLALELDQVDLTPGRLALEILETVLLDGQADANSDGDDLCAMVTALSDRGHPIHLDDFGTGHASLTSLLKLPVDTVKVDRSLISHIDTRSDQQKMALAIVELAKHLGVATMAEGVETAAERAKLADFHFTHIQGYGVAHPMPAEAVPQWIRDYTAAQALASA